jgi:hypothetical protein
MKKEREVCKMRELMTFFWKNDKPVGSDPNDRDATRGGKKKEEE